MLPMPAGCWLCQMPLAFARHGICSVCLRQLQRQPPCCPQCGLASHRPRQPCGRCLQKPPPWQQLLAVTAWQPPLSQLVNRLKFSGGTAQADMLARLILLKWLMQRRENGLPRPDLLLRVPLYHHRAWQRGYNQLDDIAARLAHWLQCRFDPPGETRDRGGNIQHPLGRLARRRNLRGAFRVESAVQGRHILLIDDVITTGSTVAEISRILLAHGAASIQAGCLCRTL